MFFSRSQKKSYPKVIVVTNKFSLLSLGHSLHHAYLANGLSYVCEPGGGQRWHDVLHDLSVPPPEFGSRLTCNAKSDFYRIGRPTELNTYCISRGTHKRVWRKHNNTFCVVCEHNLFFLTTGNESYLFIRQTYVVSLKNWFLF